MSFSKIKLTNYDPNIDYKSTARIMTKQTVVEYQFISTSGNLEYTKYVTNDGTYFLESETRSSYTNCKLLDIKKLQTTWRKVYEVEIDKKLSFTPGDAISLIVSNDLSLVDQILELLQLDGESVIQIKHTRKGCNFAYYGTLRHFFEHVYDLKMFMKKAFLYDLAQVSPHYQELYYLISNHGSIDYFNIFSSLYTIIDIIKRFDCKITLDILLNNTEFIKPRHYSFTNKKDENAKIIIGLCQANNVYGHISQYIQRACVNDTVLCAYKQNKLLNLKEHKNVIMIATGTGIAPFLSFVKNEPDRNYWLIYACRTDEDDLSKDMDVRKDVLQSSKNEDIKVFIANNMERIEEFAKDNGAIYVCASDSLTKHLNVFFSDRLPEMYSNKQIYFDMWV